MYSEDVDARRGIAQLALKGFFNLAQRWQLSRPEAMTLLGLTATSTYANWKNGKTGTLPRDTLERISYLLHIDDALRQHCQHDTHLNHWLRESHVQLHEQSPLGRMLQGNVIDLHWVQQHIGQLTLGLEAPIRAYESRSEASTVADQSPRATIHSL